MEESGRSSERAQPASRGRFGFRPSQRIRRHADFVTVYERGDRVRTRLMTVVLLKRDSGPARLGVAATRKLGGAVVRNRARRRVREVFRHTEVPDRLDVVVIPRRDMLDAEFRSIEADFRYAMRRASRRAQPSR